MLAACRLWFRKPGVPRPEGVPTTDIADLLPARQGHFRLESGHHGDLWLDLELLCVRPQSVRRLAVQLAERLAPHGVEIVCGPLVEGAFVALMVAEALDLPFAYAERSATARNTGLYPMTYRIPPALRSVVRGKRAAIVNDVVNAGSAVRGAFDDLLVCGARPVAVAALAVLGRSAAEFAAQHALRLEALASLPNTIWTPAACPLCRRGVPLENPFEAT